MNNIILYTSCSFTDLACRSVVQNFSSFQCDVTTVSTFSDLFISLRSIRKTDKTLIVIDLIRQSAYWRVNYLCALWNFRRMANNSHVMQIPFLLVGNVGLTLPGFLHHIPISFDLKDFEYKIFLVFNHKERFFLKPLKKISKNRKFLIYAVTKGLNTTQTAFIFKTSAKNIQSRHETLMKQIGLRNRYELALLSGKVLF